MDSDGAGDGDLWLRACAGEGRAFAVLFDRHVDRVFRHVMRLVSVPADADEVASAAFFELWRKRARVRLVDGSVLPWLLVTATNLARNASRGSRRYAALIERLPRSVDLDRDEDIERVEQRESLVRALRGISSTDAALVTLTALEGYSAVECAQALGLTAAAARARLLRARSKLRTVLDVDLRADAVDVESQP